MTTARPETVRRGRGMGGRLARAAAAAALAAGLTIAPASAAAGSTDEAGISVAPSPAAANVSAEMLVALQRDLKVTAEQAQARLVRADWASRLDVPLRQRLGRAYGGSWLAEDGQEFVAAITDRRLERLVRASDATPKLVARSLDELSAIAARLDTWANAAKRVPETVAGWAVDPAGNQVRVEFLPGGRAAAEAFVAAAGVADAEVVYVAGTRRPGPLADLRGGTGIVLQPFPGEGSALPTACSTGFAITDSDGKAGFLTAGHCTLGARHDVIGRHPLVPEGPVTVGRVWSVRYGGVHDEAYVRTTSLWRPVPRVEGYTQADIPVHDGVEQVPGSPVCKSGESGRLSCGTILSGFASVPDGFGGALTSLYQANTCASKGDSGGAVISGSHAQGTVTGANIPAQLCLAFTRALNRLYYVPLARSLNEFNVRLRTTTAPPVHPPVPSPAPTPHPRWTTGNQFWGGLTGSVRGRLGSVSLGANHLQVFGRGTDDRLYTSVFTDGTWGGWHGLGDVLTESPTVLARAGGIDVYYRGGDTRPYLRRFNGTGWEAPVRLGEIDVVGPINAVPSGPNTVNLFIRGSDNELKLNVFDGTQWSGWLSLGGELNASPPSAVVYPGAAGQQVIDVFARWADDTIRYRRHDPNAQPGFQPWVSLGGAWGQAPVAVNAGTNLTFVIAVHREDNTLHFQRWKDGDWLRGAGGSITTGWRGVGGNVASLPTAVAGPGDQVRVFTRDANQRVNMISWLGNDIFWEGWVSLDGDTVQPIATSPRIANQVSLIDAFGIDATTGQPLHTTLTATPAVAASVSGPTFAVGEGASFTVTGLPGAPIFWSSTQDGVVREDHAFYGHHIDANGAFTWHADEWLGAAVGSWVKQAHVGSQTAQTAQVAFTVGHRPVTIQVDKPAVQIKDAIGYAVTGPANQPIHWSSWVNGAPSGESNAFYGQYTDANGVFTLTVPWTDTRVGTWTKQVNIGGQIAQISFDVTAPPVQNWVELPPGGGFTLSAPAAATSPSGQYVLVRGTDERIYLNRFNGSIWTGWGEVPGNGFTQDAPAATGYGLGPVYAFVRGGHSIYLNRFNGSTWTGWGEVPGGGQTPSAPAAATLGGSLYLFVRGTDDGIWVNRFNGSSWTGWSPVPGGRSTQDAPAAAAFGGNLYLFGRDGDRVYVNRFNGAFWAGWSEVPGDGRIQSAPAVATSSTGLNLIMRGLDDYVYLNRLADTGAWTGWVEVPLNGITHDALGATVLGGQLSIFMRGIDNRLCLNNLTL